MYKANKATHHITPARLVAGCALAVVMTTTSAATTSSAPPSAPSAPTAVTAPKPPANTKAAQSGKAVVKAVCAHCHQTGVMNAPKIGDKKAWGKLIPEGLDALTQEAIKGVRQMPPRGGNPKLTDEEVMRAVAYMANKSGANFKLSDKVQPAPATSKTNTTPPATAPRAAASPDTTPAPAATPAAGAASDGGAGALYDDRCAACHDTGVARAPKLGDHAAWKPRIERGIDRLYQNTFKGIGVMPPRGGSNLTDTEIKMVVDFMVRRAQ